jgi:hypothetical protein
VRRFEFSVESNDGWRELFDETQINRPLADFVNVRATYNGLYRKSESVHL